MTVADAEREALLREAIAGLSARPRFLPGKLLWDEAGSILFDRICDSPDYYPTRREMVLLSDAAPEVATRVGPGAAVVEFGSGASRKIRTLLRALERPARYVAIDISRDYLEASVRRLAPDFPGVEMSPVCADYSGTVELPFAFGGSVLGFFPGTSICNLAPAEARDFLARARRALGPSRFLIGADPTQDEPRLLRAYGGCGGLMPALHLNLLTRLNRELDAGIALDDFRHEARIVRDPFRVEAHLVASRPSTWHLQGHTITIETGESIRTDVSHKYAPETFRALAENAGWTSERIWPDPDNAFALYLLKS